ncbi:MAG TPA: phenylalanine--tRNA ligase subunit alpha, partial [Candidatus Deferrimicrobium sp.]|nr:phenylalanine--tRNA ligase subunit alpha [Candidatus Deferrimicrobium sp.]
MSLVLNESQKDVLRQLKRKLIAIDEIIEALALPFEKIQSILGYFISADLVVREQKREIVNILTNEGNLYLEKKLPEEELIDLVKQGINSIRDIKEKIEDKVRFNIAIMWAKKNNWIEIDKGNVKITEKLDSILNQIEKRKKILKNPENKEAYLLKEFVERNLLEEKEKKLDFYKLKDSLTDKRIKELLTSNIKTAVSSADLMTGSWKEYQYKKYNIETPTEKLMYGRRNVYLEFLNTIREGLLSLGFEEFDSPLVDLEFYNCDLLFMPQDHVARGIHDLFFVDTKERGEIKNRKLLERVSAVHLNGADTGSTGWNYEFNEKKSSNLILRSQTTAVSAHTLEAIMSRPDPMKMFCIGKCFRPDTIDRTHSFEFWQCEGIICGENLGIQHLFGILTEICHMVGVEEIKFMPGYFPFTEPSVSGFIKHPKLGWVEALPGGIFRPELRYPYNYKKTVLAYGIGVTRLAM